MSKSPDQATYNHGTSVDLTATPGAGWHFVDWSGDASGSANPVTVLMDGNKSVTATFAINTYTLSYTAGAGGTIVGTNPQVVNHGDGTEVVATPNTGYHFVSWSDAYPTAARTDLDVTGDISQWQRDLGLRRLRHNGQLLRNRSDRNPQQHDCGLA